MADTKITALTALTGADPANDVIPIVDVSDTTMAASGTTKKISVNNILGASGTATLASATITGDLTVDTSTLKVDSANDRVGFGTASPAQFVHLSKSNTSTALTAPPVGGASLRIQNTSSTNNNFGSVEFYNAAGLFGGSVNCQFTNQATPTNDLVFVTRGSSGGLEHYRIAADGVCTWSEVGGVAGTAMTLNATGLGVGGSPVSGMLLTVGSTSSVSATANAFQILSNKGTFNVVADGSTNAAGTTITYSWANGGQGPLIFRNAAISNVMTLDASGNCGIGVTPSAGWRAGSRALQLGAARFVSLHEATNGSANLAFGAYESGANAYSYTTTGDAPSRYSLISGRHEWFNAPSGTAGTAITFTQAMTLDASGNLLVGTTTGSRNCIYKSVAVGSIILDVQSPSTATISTLTYAADASGASATNTVFLVQKVNATSRSINAAGTVNASGADYAEYMTKAGDFVLAKGDVAGIDANGNLTNVFADAVSFVVKSTDPSYVGNDKWGVDLEGDALEAARQLVDRIAFAGQVPVNVTGAKAGDYIVPVVDGSGIKGIAVSNPTFEQYQLAVGKVIAIDADGRARIIVKVA